MTDIIAKRSEFDIFVTRADDRLIATDPITIKNQIQEIHSIDDLGLNTQNRADGSLVTWNANTNSYYVKPFNTYIPFLWSNTHIFNANVTFNSAILANNSPGLSGQVLASNGHGVYWSTPTVYAFSTGLTNTSNTITVNAAYIATISANNASFLGGNPSTFFAANSSLANYYLATNPAGYVNATSGTANNSLFSNNASFLSGKAESTLNVNNAIFANNASFLGGNPSSFFAPNTALANYYLATNPAGYVNATSGTANNSLFSNNSSFLNGRADTFFAANSSLANYYLATNPAGYITSSANITGSANSATYLGGKLDTFFAANSSLANYYLATNPAGYVNSTSGSANNSLFSNNANFLGGKLEANLNVNNAVYSTNSSLANNTTYFGGNLPSYFTNATNILSGTIAEPRLPFRMNQNVTSTSDVQFGNMSITGNLTIGGGITTINANNLSITDNMFYLNNGIDSTITNISGNGTVVSFTANNNFSAGWDVVVTGVNPASYNGTYQNILLANATHFQVSNTNVAGFVGGGNARGKSDLNPDIGFAAGYNDGTYHHSGFFRDHNNGTWKVFDNYDPEPDISIYIDQNNASYRNANFMANTIFVGNNTVFATITPTNFSGTANNASFLGGNAPSFFAANSSLANYYLATNPAGYITSSANITGSANSATYLGGKLEANLNVNSAVYATNAQFSYTANSATYFGGATANAYQTNAGLTANIAAYLPTYRGVLAANDLFIANSIVFTDSTSGYTTTILGNPAASSSDTYYWPTSLSGGGQMWVDATGNMYLQNFNYNGSYNQSTTTNTIVLDTIPQMYGAVFNQAKFYYTPGAYLGFGSLPINTTYYFVMVAYDAYGNPVISSEFTGITTSVYRGFSIQGNVNPTLTNYQFWFGTTSGGQNKYFSVTPVGPYTNYSFSTTTGATSGTLPSSVNKTASIQFSTVIPTYANTSQTAWGTNGIGLIIVPSKYTDNTTVASGTVETSYMNLFGTQTYAASNTGVTVTNLYGTYFQNPANGTNVVATNKYAIGADSLSVGGSAFIANSIYLQSSGQVRIANSGISSSAWSTSGIGLIQSPATWTDTSTAVNGTVTTAYMNYFAPQTYAASNTGVTVTSLYGTYFSTPVAGTNVTATARYGVGADSIVAITTLATGGAGSLSVGTGGVTIAGGGFTYSGAATNFAVSALTSGLLTLGGTSGTGIITLGQSTVSQTTNIQAGATASGSTKTVNIGTSGVSGSTTTITIGSSVSGATQTTTVNGRVTLAPIGASTASWTTNGVGLIQSAATFTDNTTATSGTVTTAYMNYFAPQTYAASNTGVTVTNLYGTYFSTPVAGTNVTGGTLYSLGTEGGLYVGGDIKLFGAITTTSGTSSNFGTLGVTTSLTTTGAVALTGGTNTISITNTTGQIQIGGLTASGAITIGRSTGSQTINISNGITASGSTNTIAIGTAGATGSTTNITIGSSAGTSTTTINGAAAAASTLTVGSTLTVNGGTANIITGTGSTTANISTGATTNGNTKTVNIGTSGVSGSTTTITIGSTNGTTTTVNGSTVFTGTFQSQGYTVATLPTAGTAGRRAHVTDALTPTFLGTLTGGGSVRCPVFDNGTAWVAG